jgi:RNA polymerase sigma-70 factor, ECF subfamily
MTAIRLTGAWLALASQRSEPGSAGQRSGGGELPMAAGAEDVSFGDFYTATVRRIVRQAYALTGNLADAQDIAQEAFARAWQRWDSVRACDSPEAWVRRVTINLATNRYRRERTARAAARQLLARDVPEISPDTVALVAGLRALPERQRVVLVLHYLADLPVSQIAAELRCPVGSVKGWLSRGRDALHAVLSEENAGLTPRPASSAPVSPEVTGA